MAGAGLSCRVEDIPVLAVHFLSQLRQEVAGITVKEISAGALDRFAAEVAARGEAPGPWGLSPSHLGLSLRTHLVRMILVFSVSSRISVFFEMR